MPGDLTIRKVRTGSGATAVQVVKYEKRKCKIVRHIGSANSDDELSVLLQEAETIRVQYYDPTNRLRVVTETNGDIVTIIPGRG